MLLIQFLHFVSGGGFRQYEQCVVYDDQLIQLLHYYIEVNSERQLNTNMDIHTKLEY